MKVCILNSSDGRYGGFSAVVRLHENLLRCGCDSTMLVAKKQSNNDTIVEVSRWKYNLSRLITRLTHHYRMFFRKGYKEEYYFDPYGKTFVTAKNILDKLNQKPDVIVANWINGFITVQQLKELSELTGAPVIWYLLDMSPFTGGCHFSWSCLGYQYKCGSCPALISSNVSDASHQLWLYKEKYTKDLDLTVVSGTQWLKDQSVSSSLFGHKKQHKIMLSVNEEVFKPVEKSKARSLLGINDDAKVLFFGAKSIAEKRKGMEYLFKALDALVPLLMNKRINVLLLIAGNEVDIDPKINDYYQKHYLGYIHNDEMLVAAYQSSNAYLSPSIEDSGPMMINESMMCGTPVVAFNIGVSNELVINKETGYKVNLFDCEEFSKGIYEILIAGEYEEKLMSDNCRSMAMEFCSRKVQADAFISLFEDVVQGNKSE